MQITKYSLQDKDIKDTIVTNIERNKCNNLILSINSINYPPVIPILPSYNVENVMIEDTESEISCIDVTNCSSLKPNGLFSCCCIATDSFDGDLVAEVAHVMNILKGTLSRIIYSFFIN